MARDDNKSRFSDVGGLNRTVGENFWEKIEMNVELCYKTDIQNKWKEEAYETGIKFSS